MLPVLVALLAGGLAAIPSWRAKLQQRFSQSEREVLATADGDLLGDGTAVRAIKYRKQESIYVDVVKADPSGVEKLVDRVSLPDKHDGFFNFMGHVTRLAIADVDGDGSMELLAPTFDNQLVPHLNVFRYNPGVGRFELFQPGK